MSKKVCPWCNEAKLTETNNKWAPYKCENCGYHTANPITE